ncbi:MAG: hypothetical protein JWP66_559 [Naasia sp.]|nr:hypothetical protein [Naasia sp.]
MDPALETDAARLAAAEPWRALKAAVIRLQALQRTDGSLAEDADRTLAGELVAEVAAQVAALAPTFPHDAGYLSAVRADLAGWVDAGFPIPDFVRSLTAFSPASAREDDLAHLVVFPMYTQNGSRDRLFEAVLLEVRWPEFAARLEAGAYSNAMFLPVRFLDFTPGYDSDSAVLFPETVSIGVSPVPAFTWGAIFADREAARFRRVVTAAAGITRLQLPADAAPLLEDQGIAEETFVLWDLIHDRTHMRGDLPFDPFMIKQRMPYFLYALEELRCDLTAFREAVRLVRADDTDDLTRDRARLAQYAILFDRLFRFPLTGTRVRNYDGLGGQLLFAWLHQVRVLHWTDRRLAFDWADVPDAVVALSDAIDELYWRSIDRPKTAHWLAAYELIRSVLTPAPASNWAGGLSDEVLAGPPGGFTDAVLDDEFPLSMFYEALGRKLADAIVSTSGITGRD